MVVIIGLNLKSRLPAAVVSFSDSTDLARQKPVAVQFAAVHEAPSFR